MYRILIYLSSLTYGNLLYQVLKPVMKLGYIRSCTQIFWTYSYFKVKGDNHGAGIPSLYVYRHIYTFKLIHVAYIPNKHGWRELVNTRRLYIFLSFLYQKLTCNNSLLYSKLIFTLEYILQFLFSIFLYRLCVQALMILMLQQGHATYVRVLCNVSVTIGSSAFEFG